VESFQGFTQLTTRQSRHLVCLKLADRMV